MTDYPTAIAAAREALTKLREHDGGMRYNGDDDEVGELACCRVASWKPHDSDCPHAVAVAEFDNLLAALDAQKPSGFAYRYRDALAGGTVIRFNSGHEVNGSRPIEAVPYWLGAPPAPVALTVLQDLSERFSAMHANGDVWITSVAAAKMAQTAATQAQQPAAAVLEGGLRDSVLNSAKFRASCYALVGIVEGIEGLGRNWAANGERLKDTREWVAFYNCVASMRNGTFNQASAKQAQQPAALVPEDHK